MLRRWAAGALQGRVLRPGNPIGIIQEMRALLALYQALRTAVTDAVQSVPGTDPRPGTYPDRASYQAAVETAQNLVTAARNITGPARDLTGDIGRAVLANLDAPRRPASAPASSDPRSAAGTSTPTANPARTTVQPASPPTLTPATTNPRHTSGNT